MALRILGGKLKGVNLSVNDKVTRPTGVLLKRKVFDARQVFDGIHFIDLCAGSGSIGFEALSRGADLVTLVDSDRLAVNLMQASLRNVEARIKSSLEVSIIKTPILKWIPHFLSRLESDNYIVFFDPPYADEDLYDKVLDLFNNSNFKGELWVEYDKKSSNSLLERLDSEYDARGVKKYSHGLT